MNMLDFILLSAKNNVGFYFFGKGLGIGFGLDFIFGKK
jgi:hypothetical protein